MIGLAILADEMGTSGETPEEERDYLVKILGEEGLEVRLDWFGTEARTLPDQADLMVVDVGGLSAMPGGGLQSMADDIIRRVRRWAEEHPGSLVVLWTSFTARTYKWLLEDEGLGEPDNIWLFPQNDWDAWSPWWDKLRAWYGIEEAA